MNDDTKRLAERILSDGRLFLEAKLPFWRFETSFHESSLAAQDLPPEKREELLALDSKLDDTEFGDDEELQKEMVRGILSEVARIFGLGDGTRGGFAGVNSGVSDGHSASRM